MSWFKLAGEGAFHAKVIEAGNEAYGAWCRAGQWSSDHLTEGFIPKATALLIAPAPIWKRLVDAKAGHEHGLAEVRPDGWQIHDYLDWNPDAEQVQERRKAKVEAGRAGGKRSGEARRKRPPEQPPSNAEASGEASASPLVEAPPKQNGSPYPYPSPYPSQSSSLREEHESRAGGGAGETLAAEGQTLADLAETLRLEGSPFGAAVCERLAKGHRPTDGQLATLRKIQRERRDRPPAGAGRPPRGGAPIVQPPSATPQWEPDEDAPA